MKEIKSYKSLLETYQKISQTMLITLKQDGFSLSLLFLSPTFLSPTSYPMANVNWTPTI